PARRGGDRPAPGRARVLQRHARPRPGGRDTRGCAQAAPAGRRREPRDGRRVRSRAALPGAAVTRARALAELRAIVNPRALAAWAGTDRLSALAFHMPRSAAHTPAGKLFALLVAGDELDGPPPLAVLRDQGLVE